MNIKSIFIRAAESVQRLAHTIFDVPVPSTPAILNGAPVEAHMPSRACDARMPTDKPVVTEIGGSQRPAEKRRPRSRTCGEIEVVPLEQRKWLTVREASARFPCFSEKALRHLISSAEAYAKYPKSGLRSNGFIDCVVRPAGQRKILIDADRFEQWLRDYSVARGRVRPSRSPDRSAGAAL